MLTSLQMRRGLNEEKGMVIESTRRTQEWAHSDEFVCEFEAQTIRIEALGLLGIRNEIDNVGERSWLGSELRTVIYTGLVRRTVNISRRVYTLGSQFMWLSDRDLEAQRESEIVH